MSDRLTHSASRGLRRLLPVATVVAATATLALVAPSPAQAAPASDICVSGYVWREAVAGDRVCVTPQTRSLASDDNSQARLRLDPKGAYGPYTCVSGYVWRTVVPNDLVCVLPSTRSQAAYDNSQAPFRRMGNGIVLHTRITFGNGVPVGGWANLTVFGDGSYNFSGHFHDSGFPSYNTGIVWALRASNGTVFTFSNTGHVAGTISPGSRDHDWNISGVNPALARSWESLNRGYNSQVRARASLDVVGLFNDIKAVIGYVSQVVAVVGPIVG
jgi:hypothetical protein